jgi:hypothetical protein
MKHVFFYFFLDETCILLIRQETAEGCCILVKFWRVVFYSKVVETNYEFFFFVIYSLY